VFIYIQGVYGQSISRIVRQTCARVRVTDVMDHAHYAIDGEIRRQYRRFNAVGTQLTVRLLPPTDPYANVASHFQDSVTGVLDYALRDTANADMIGVAIRNARRSNDKPIGLSFRRKGQISGDVIWSVFGKVAQSNSRFDATHTLIVDVHSVRMPAGFGERNFISRRLSLRPASSFGHAPRHAHR
jgi:hypothetical protein